MAISIENFKNVKKGGKSQGGVNVIPNDDLAELKADLDVIIAEITAKRAQLAGVEVKIRYAEHDVRLHANYHGPRSDIVFADQAIVRDLQLKRQNLAIEYQGLVVRQQTLQFQLSEIQKKQVKQLALEGDPEIRAAGRLMLQAVQTAIATCEDYWQLRKSFARPNPLWQFPFKPLTEKAAADWVEKVRRWLHDGK